MPLLLYIHAIKSATCTAVLTTTEDAGVAGELERETGGLLIENNTYV